MVRKLCMAGSHRDCGVSVSHDLSPARPQILGDGKAERHALLTEECWTSCRGCSVVWCHAVPHPGAVHSLQLKWDEVGNGHWKGHFLYKLAVHVPMFAG